MSEESLTSFIEEICGDSHLRVEAELGDGYVRLRTAEAERRQAKHDIRSAEDIVIEMLRNSRDANARHIFVATAKEGNYRRIRIIDDGDGIPLAMQKKIFEPRVTSKLDTMTVDAWGVHGRGMALYSIQMNSELARVVASYPHMGAAFSVDVSLDSIAEKTDQSTWPRIETDDAGNRLLRGPKNILRTVVEFAIESNDDVEVFLGSATEIAATLFLYGKTTLPTGLRVFCHDVEEVPIAQRLGTAADPESLSHIAEGIGLPISVRSARRILDQEIKPLDSMIESILHRAAAPIKQDGTRHHKSTRKDFRSLKIGETDLVAFSQDLQTAFGKLAESYYLESDVDPIIKVEHDGIRVTFPTNKLR